VSAACHFGYARHSFVSPAVERVDQRKFLLYLLVYAGMKTSSHVLLDQTSQIRGPQSCAMWPAHVLICVCVCVYVYIYLFVHLVVCLTTGPRPLPKRTLYIVRSRASSFKWEYPLLSLRSSSSFLRLLPCLPVTYIPPCIFPSVTRCRRQFLRKMWPIQFVFHLRISCRIFLCSLNLSNTS